MKRKNNKLNYSLVIFFSIVAILEVFLITNCANTYVSYRFPTVIDQTAFLKFVGICLILPLILFVLSCVFICAKKKQASIVMLGLSIAMIVVAFIFHSAQALFAPPICSSTENPANFGLYDERVVEIATHSPFIGFPKGIPEDAKNVQYKYFYSYASSEILYVAVSWQCPDESSFQGLIQNLPDGGQKISDHDGEQVYHFLGDEYKKRIYPYYVTAAIFNSHSNRVYYVAVHNNSSLPTCGADVFQ